MIVARFFSRRLPALGLGWSLLLGLMPLLATAGAGLPPSLPPVQEIPVAADMRPELYTVAQSPDGMIHAAGIGGISSYDGRRHRLMTTPNGRLVRVLRHDGDQRLYVGGYGQFGYLSEDVYGELQFTDLTPPLEDLADADNLADIWEILIAPEGVLFRALFHLFFYQPDSGEMRVWHHPGRLGVITRHEGEILLQFRGVGLKRFDGEDFVLVPGGEQLTNQVFALLPLPEGGLLTLARDDLWQRFHEGRLEAWPAPSTLPGSGAFGSSLMLADGSFALGGVDGRLHVLDPQSRQHRWFQIGTAYLSDLQPALDGGLLAQMDSGTLHVQWPSPWTMIGAEAGLNGRVEHVVQHAGHWFAITNAGVYRSREIAPGELNFANAGLTSFESWDWWSDDPERGLLADAYNILTVDSDLDHELIVENIYARRFKTSRHDPDRLHVGTELGLAMLERVENRWQPRFIQQGFTGKIDSMVELDEHRLLMGVEGSGLVLATYASDHRSLTDWQVLEPGLDTRPPYVVRLPDGHIAVSTATGFFQWREEQLEPMQLGNLDEFLANGEVLHIKSDNEGRLWAWDFRQLLRQIEDGRWQKEDVSALNPGHIASVSFDRQHATMVGGQASILLFEPGVETVSHAPPGVRLRSVISQLADGRQRRLPLDGRRIELPHDTVNLVFEYALPTFQRPELNRYRARIVGYETDFSDWGSVTRIVYSSRHIGDLRLEVEARDWRGQVSAIEPFEFTILPPWYRSHWAVLAWVLLFLMFLGLFIHLVLRWRLARLTAERERLAEMVRQRTQELAAANRKLKNMANVDGLTGVANRRRLDEYLAEAWTRCIDRRCQLALILIDVDHFKRFNDEQGHQAGDEVLREVATILTGGLRRAEDIAARYGGEEFMVVMPAAELHMAQDVAEDLRRRIEASPLGVTVSMGVACDQPTSTSQVSELIETADQALYRAKDQGRNRVEVANRK
jgi:diguanylate cyclase (GGDEF)-like protein